MGDRTIKQFNRIIDKRECPALIPAVIFFVLFMMQSYPGARRLKRQLAVRYGQVKSFSFYLNSTDGRGPESFYNKINTQ